METAAEDLNFLHGTSRLKIFAYFEQELYFVDVVRGVVLSAVNVDDSSHAISSPDPFIPTECSGRNMPSRNISEDVE